MATGLVKTRIAGSQGREVCPRGGGLLLMVSLLVRMDAIWLITRSLAVGAVFEYAFEMTKGRSIGADGEVRRAVLIGVSWWLKVWRCRGVKGCGEVEMESSACVPKVGSLASRARNDFPALFYAQLGKTKFTRLNWLWFVPEANT